MSQANVTWGSPRIVGELAKIGINVAKATVEKYMIRPRQPPSPTWKAFVKNHVKDLVAIDFFVVPTVRFAVLFVLIILAHERRRVLHFNITPDPTAERTAQQIVEAFPYDAAPRFLLRDRDGCYGQAFRRRVEAMGIEEVLAAPRSPGQNPFVERMIGSIRRDCLDHAVVFNERHLRRLMTEYIRYHHESRTHLALAMDCPTPRAVQARDVGSVVELDQLGGLHHRYERHAA